MCARVCVWVSCMGGYEEDKRSENKYAEIVVCLVAVVVIIIIGNSGINIVVLPKCAYSGLF